MNYEQKLTQCLRLYNQASRAFYLCGELPDNHPKRFTDQFYRVHYALNLRLDRRRKILNALPLSELTTRFFDYTYGYP